MIPDPAFALMMREKQRPNECTQKRGCWVNVGSKGCDQSGYKALRCTLCKGIIQLLPMSEFHAIHREWLARKNTP